MIWLEKLWNNSNDKLVLKLCNNCLSVNSVYKQFFPFELNRFSLEIPVILLKFEQIRYYTPRLTPRVFKERSVHFQKQFSIRIILLHVAQYCHRYLEWLCSKLAAAKFQHKIAKLPVFTLLSTCWCDTSQFILVSIPWLIERQLAYS